MSASNGSAVDGLGDLVQQGLDLLVAELFPLQCLPQAQLQLVCFSAGATNYLHTLYRVQSSVWRLPNY